MPSTADISVAFDRDGLIWPEPDRVVGSVPADEHVDRVALDVVVVGSVVMGFVRSVEGDDGERVSAEPLCWRREDVTDHEVFGVLDGGHTIYPLLDASPMPRSSIFWMRSAGVVAEYRGTPG